MLKNILREPLFHFGLLALLIFAAYAVIAPAAVEPADTEITISAPKVAQMAEIFARTWQRPPSEAELNGLIEDYIDEEIHVRAALSLGLDQDDTVIRRRLRQKMEFLQDGEVEALTPTEDELAAYLAAHPGQFALDPKFAFDQIFLSPDKRGDAVTADANALQASLAAGLATDPATLGDPSLLPATLGLTPFSRISSQFGPDFAEALKRAPDKAWSLPIASAYGLHLVRVTAVEPGRVPPLDEVRAEVMREWSNAKSVELAAAYMKTLRAGYKITVQKP
jgi:hypothetical protein